LIHIFVPARFFIQPSKFKDPVRSFNLKCYHIFFRG
jgi:hypothetical protein